ncbi:uncharacterized protein LOC116112163 isoform X2 [Pistacia vera]|uniref:uncharacterized protein LOC116112163 isoform X2 n=1 Tax=Pistacia vera TaxID=55513 RepID=UPI0012633710|nr:uncharacterized protein LOC116112163 isoform X2 [Pistacia vera]
MKRTLFYARNFLFFPPKFNASHKISPIQLAFSARPTVRFYTSESDSSNFAQTQSNNGGTDVQDVSNEELKRRIERYFEGDEEAIPSIFEAILSRKLAGKHEESDDELMEEIRRKNSEEDHVKEEEEFDSEQDK